VAQDCDRLIRTTFARDKIGHAKLSINRIQELRCKYTNRADALLQGTAAFAGLPDTDRSFGGSLTPRYTPLHPVRAPSRARA
jgi:hypothetical protein